MLKTRLIPLLLLKSGLLVRSEKFETYQVIGNPLNEVIRFNEWSVDELIYLDITRNDDDMYIRQDHKVKWNNDILTILDKVSSTCFVPLTCGGGIKSIEDMRQRFLRGADKITLNTWAFRNPELIQQGARLFGNQAIVIVIDVIKQKDKTYKVCIEGGRTIIPYTPIQWARTVEKLGAGEILLQSIDRDGTGIGYDTEIISQVSKSVRIPVIACGGVGKYEHYIDGIKAGASAVSAANIWHFKELSDKHGKRVMKNSGIYIRI
jgi:imidazole glycerol-phosphate synthase subunit HisF